MEAAFAEALSEAVRRGSGAAWTLWLREIADLAGTGVRLRLGRIEGSRRRRGRNVRDMGNDTFVRSSTRGAWGMAAIERWMQDLRYAIRTLGKNPVFTLTAVASLALGIGANTAVYSIIRAAMFRTLPVENPHELVALQVKGGQSGPYFTHAMWEAIRDSEDALAGLVAYSEDRFDISEGIESHFVRGLWVSGGYFDVLGVPAARGRVLTSEDDRSGCGPAGPVAVISYDFWQRQYQADPAAIGRALRLDRKVFTIVGVTPSWMKGLDRDLPFDVAIPIGCEPLLHGGSSQGQNGWWLQIAGRMKAGASIAETEARLNTFAPRIFRATVPASFNADARTTYLSSELELLPAATGFSVVRVRYRTALFALMAIAALALLIACANIANLLLVRAEVRRHEISMRRALGASRWRLIRQLLTESLLLSAAGAAGGYLLALWGGRILVRSISTTINPVDLDLTPDLHLLGVTAAIAVLTAMVFGLVPALRATRAGRSHALEEHRRGAVGGSSRFRLGRGLAAAQLAVSFVLLLGAGLFLGTLRNLLSVDLGFRADGVLLVSVDLQRSATQLPERIRMGQEILDRIRMLPGVTAASSSLLTPIGSGGWNELITADGAGAEPESGALMYRNRVSSGYFQTMGTPLVAGRDFNESDGPGAPPVMVIDQSAARKLFGSANPLGRTIRTGNAASGRLYQVIGVVKDAKYGRVDETERITGFDAMRQANDRSPRSLNFELRHATPLDQLAPAVKAALADVSPALSLEFRSLETQVDESLRQQRLLAALSTAFGALALSLSVIGLYGLTAYSVARRRGEIGLRVALGARTGSVVWLILRDAAAMLAAGTTLGVLGALAARKLVAGLLFGVAPSDPVQMLGAASILAAATMVAACLPTWRAARLDPAKVLREQ